MTRFALLVRGINVGGKNKVVMAELREELKTIGLDEVETYINSGNIFFESAASKAELVDLLELFFRDHYPFIQSFSLFSAEDYAQDIAALPAWWQEDLARKDVLFYTEGLDQESVWELVSSFRSVMKSSIVAILGSTGVNTQKRPIQRPLTTDKSSRCRFTVF